MYNRRCLSVCLLPTLRKRILNWFASHFQGSLAMVPWTNEQFWWQSGSRIRIHIRILIWIRIWICIATLVRHALAEVCTVPVLLVNICSEAVKGSHAVNSKEYLPVTLTSVTLWRTVTSRLWRRRCLLKSWRRSPAAVAVDDSILRNYVITRHLT